ncbi:TerB N-terminal domain-containing protein [Enterococcus quebecensis]|uniref:TerB-C domain-containing protein n=1 Tax=Enterococcus quebecensis TaxID=903983 RepID=A0A1E5GUJ4_9ENTE|nr:TerB N-terminal domain-containing protein [Enterococcus quebecensis]OEG16338.1 hypothetical protein BCR23_05465 [Enterococcus quebecensis]OJG72792.1 hypothetical protein RV12_GL000890 [Enterococcus quebecensis]
MKKLIGIILNLFGGFWLFFGVLGGIVSSNDFTSGTIVALIGLGIFSLGNKIKQSKTTLWEDTINKVHLDYDKIDQIKQSIFSWWNQISPLVLAIKKKLLTHFKSFQHNSEDKNKKMKVKPEKIIREKKIDPAETIKIQQRNVKNQVVAEIVKSSKEEKIRMEKKGVQNKIDDKIFVKEEQYNTNRYSSKKELFYNESDIILAEYRHLTTPEELLKAIADPNRNSYSYSTLGAKEFIRDSLKYKNSSGSYCEPVELTSYYTTFSDLNNEQKAWYFYWRTNALNLNFLDVDLSYIYLFTYELLNYSFNENAAFNVSMLVHLHEAYKEKYRVDRLKEVIFDMLLELNQTDLTKKWINERYTPPLYSNLKEEKEISTISMSVWKTYLKYYRETKFFKANRSQIYKTFKTCTFLLNDFYEKESLKIIDVYFEEKTESRQAYLFSGMVILRETSVKTYSERHIYATDRAYEDISAFFKLAENVTRVIQGEKRQLEIKNNPFHTALHDEMLEYMNTLKNKKRFKQVMEPETSAFGSLIPQPLQVEKKQQVVIVFDDERIKQLQKETDALVSEVNKRIEDYDSQDDMERISKIQVEKTTSINSNDFFAQSVEIDEKIIEEFAETLHPIERSFLSLFKNLTIENKDAEHFAKKHGQMLSILITDINEKSLDRLDDNLIEEKDSVIELYEEFQSIITKMKEIEKV